MSNQTEQQSNKALTNSTDIHNLVYLADRGGTGWWRHIQAIDVFGAVQRATGIFNTYTEQFIADPNYYIHLNSVTVQRWTSHSQREAFEKFLLPVTRQSKTALIYAIDDAMGAKDIPLYNAGHDAFQPQEVQDDIKFMLTHSDLVVVTTQHLKEYYNREYGVQMEKLVAVPNMLPAFWFGDRYDIDKKMVQFGQNKAKPRVGIIGSLSHFNYRNVLGEDGKPVPDDLDMVVDVIRNTVDDFQWVVLGTIPEQLKDLVQKRKIECYGCCPILSYPSFLCELNLQAAVAPLRPMEFNYCKSPIKHLECSAIGVPLFAQNCLPYKGVVPENQLFDNQNDLQEKLMKMKFSSMGAYKKMVENNWNLINSPHEDGDFKLKTSWMENNLGVWMSIFKFNPFKAAESDKSEQVSGANNNG